VEILNNLFKIRAITLSKLNNEGGEDEQSRMKKLSSLQNMLVKSKNLDVNYHGFANNARQKGSNFDKTLDNLLINSYTLTEYFEAKPKKNRNNQINKKGMSRYR